MENPTNPLDGPQILFSGSREKRPAEAQPLADFVPLRLVMLPSRLALELTRSDMLIGRPSSADVRLPLPDVSRRHCRFVCSEGTWQVMDLASLNGVFINGVKVNQANLYDQDVIDIGGFRFLVEIKNHA